MNKKMFALLVVPAVLLFAGQALAHATVKPAEVGIGKYQTFTLAVPSEKPIATVGIRLVIPEGINGATPNVKPGWRIEKKTQATGNKVEDEHGVKVDEQKLTEIVWVGGRIPVGQRDEFLFSVKAPSTSTILNWKVYQTYADGTIVSWDLDPTTEPKNGSGPYSSTKVVDDLSPAPIVSTPSDSNSSTALALSVIAFVMALLALRKANRNN